MAIVALSASPATLDSGGSEFVSVTNTGAVDVVVSRGPQSFTLRPGQSRTVYPEGAAVTATASGTGQVATLAQAAQVTQSQQVAANTAAIAGLPGTYAGIGATAPAAKVPPKRTLTVLANTGVAGHGYTANSNAASSNMNDTSSFVMGTQSASVVTKGNGSAAGIRNNSVGPLNLTGKCLEVVFRVTNTAHLKGVTLYVGDTALANFNVYTLMDTVGGPVNSVGEGEWVTLCVSLGAIGATTGTPNLAAVTSLQLSFTDDNTGAAVTGYLQSIKSFSKSSTYPNGVVSLTFDDSYASQWSVCRPKLETYGFQGTFYTICDAVGLNASYMTLAQLKALQDNGGHEIAPHAFTAANHNVTGGFTSLTTAQLDAELRGLKNWLSTNGFMARDHFCYPQGLMNPATEQVVRAYYSSARLTQRYPYETTNPGNVHRLHAISVNTPISLATVEAAVDLAYSSGSWLILTFHDIVASPSGGSVPQWDTTSFNSLIDYLNTKGIPVRTIGDVLATP